MASNRAVLVFAASSGPQPWPCYFCTGPVAFTMETTGGSNKQSPVLHHIDGNHGNDSVSNWSWAHFGCHSTHHYAGNKWALGMKHSAEAKEKIGARTRGTRLSAEHREAIAKTMASLPDVACEVCGRLCRPFGLANHQRHKHREWFGTKNG